MKQKPCLRCLSVLLILCLLLSGLPVSGAAAQAVGAEESLSPAPEPPLQEETITPEPLDTGGILSLVDAQTFEAQGFTRRVTEDESLSTYVFQKETGEKTVYFFGENVKYEKDGVIYHKDLTLVPQSGGYGVAQNEVALHLPQNPAKGILVAYGGMGIRILPQGLASGIQGIAENGAVVYENAYGNGIDLKYTPIFSGVKEDIILPQYMQEASFSFLLETVGASLYQDGQGWYLAADAQAEPALRMGDTLVYDAIGKPCQGGLTVETVTPGSQYRVTVSAPDSFLSDPETVYPVTVDPTVVLQNTTDGTSLVEDSVLFAAYPNYNYGAFLFDSIGLTQVNYGTARTIMRLTGFINSTLYGSLSAKQVTNVKFYVTEASGRPSQRIHLYPIMENPTWTESTVTWNNAGIFDTSWECYADVDDSQITPFDITALVKAWKNGTYNANAGFILINDDETAYKQIFASDHSAADYRPYVVMEYSPNISLNQSSLNLAENSTALLMVATSPRGYTVTFSSNNNAVAEVNSAGVVTAKKAGIATITASATISNLGTCSTTCTVYVYIPNGIYYFHNANTGSYFMEAESARIENNTNVRLNSSSSTAPFKAKKLSQIWKVFYLGSGQYSIRPMHKLDMALTKSGTDAVIRTVGTTDSISAIPSDSRWQISRTDSGFVIKNRGGTALQMASATVSYLGEVVVKSFSSTQMHHYWSLDPATDPGHGVIMYETRAQDDARGRIRYVAPEESRTLEEIWTAVAVYSSSTINQEVTWRSSDPTIATVDEFTGTVTGVSAGEVSITATTVSPISGMQRAYSYPLTVTQLPIGCYYLKNRATDRYADIENQTMANGTQIHQWDFHGGASQQWIFAHIGDGYYSIRSANSTDNFYLSIQDASSDNDTSAVLLSGELNAGSRWKIAISARNNFVLKAESGDSDNRVLAVGSYAVNVNGIDIQQRDFVDDNNCKDEWSLLKHPDSIVWEAQQESVWCWVACAKMMSTHYTVYPISQASVAVYTITGKVTDNPSAEDLSKTYFCAPIHSIDRAIEHITGVNNVYSAENKIYSEAVLRSLLDNNTPVTILWGHYDNSGVRSYGHYVVIFGYHWEGSRNEYVYDYYDPNPETKGESRYKSYSELCRHHDYNSLSNSDEIVLWESIITFKEGSYAQVIDRPVL